MSEEYYTEEFTSLPLRVIYSMFRRTLPAGVAYPLAAYLRLRYRLGIPPVPLSGTGPVGSGRFVTRDELSPRNLSRWAPHLERLHDLGFRPVYYRVADVIGAKESTAALFLDGAGSTFALLQWLRMHGGSQIEERSPLEFNSFGPVDPEIMTGMLDEDELIMADIIRLDFVDQHIVSSKQGVRKAYQLHRERIAGRNPFQFPLDMATDEFTRHSQRRFDWLLEHGLLRRLSAAEINRVRKCRLPDEI